MKIPIIGKSYKVKPKADFCTYGETPDNLGVPLNKVTIITILVTNYDTRKMCQKIVIKSNGTNWAVNDFIWLDEAKRIIPWL